MTITIKTTHMGYRIPVMKGGYLKEYNINMQQYYALFTEDMYDPSIKRYMFVNAYRYYDKEKEELYIPIFDLPRLEKFLKMHKVDYKIEELPDVKGKLVDIPLKPNFTTKDERQAKAVDYLIHNDRPMRGLNLQTGGGKGNTLDTNIKIPGGWKLMKNIRVGDIIIAWDGSFTTVTGVFPQGIKPVYKVTFMDGRSTKVDDTHLWEIYDSDNGFKVITTIEVMKLLSKKNKRLYVRCILPECCENIELPVPPFEFPDTDIKFIPDEYLNASVQQRLELLMGFINTVNKKITDKAEIIIKTPIMRLARDIQYLARSLGGISSVKCDTRSNIYSVSIIMYATMLGVKSVEYVGELPTQCITIDHPQKLYVVDDFIVTHNTAAVIMASHYLKRRIMINMTSLADQWRESYLKFTNLTNDDIYTIQGSDSVHYLLENIDKTIFPKVIIANTPTLQFYEKEVSTDQFNDFCKLCDIGIRVIDEVHLRFKVNLMMDIRFNPAITIPVTATFKRTSPKVDYIFQQHYSVEDRFGEGKYHKYVKVVEYIYFLNDTQFPKKGFRGYMGLYNHINFERWLLNDKCKSIKRIVYNEVHERILKDTYFSIHNKGEKALVLFSTVNMCVDFCEYLQKHYPSYRINYCVESLSIDEISAKSDIIISTPKKAGTGVDIKNLRTVYVTISVNSPVENEQHLGRLRKLKDASITPIFAYSVCVSVVQQVRHAETRRKLFHKLAMTTDKVNINVLYDL